MSEPNVGTTPSHVMSRTVESEHKMQPARYAFALLSYSLVCTHMLTVESTACMVCCLWRYRAATLDLVK